MESSLAKHRLVPVVTKPIRQVETFEDRLTVIAEFPTRGPGRLFDFFVVPELLQSSMKSYVEVEAT